MAVKHVKRINPSKYNESSTDNLVDFVRDEVNLARKLDAFNTDNDFVAFDIADAEEVVIDAEAHEVHVTMPNATDLSDLTATFKLSPGATMDPEDLENVDFTSPVEVTITSAYGEEQVWEITVVEADPA